MSIFIENGTIINEGLSFKGSLFVENGIISAITDDPTAFSHLRGKADDVIDATGMLILPEVIDDQGAFSRTGSGT